MIEKEELKKALIEYDKNMSPPCEFYLEEIFEILDKLPVIFKTPNDICYEDRRIFMDSVYERTKNTTDKDVELLKECQDYILETELFLSRHFDKCGSKDCVGRLIDKLKERLVLE